MADLSPGADIEIRRYLAIFHKRKSLIASCLILSLAVATVYNYTTRPVYRATAQILIDRRSPTVLPSMADQIELAELSDLQTQLQLLSGRSIAEAVVEKLQLHKTAELQTGPLMSPWERFQRKFLGGVPQLVDGDGLPLSPAVAAFRSRLDVEPVAQSRLVNLHFRAYDPGVAQKAVNNLAQLYIEQSVDLRASTTSDASGWLSEQIKEQQDKLRSAESALQQYREKDVGGGGSEDQQTLNEQKVSSLNQALISARLDRIQKETLLNQVRTAPASQLETLAVVQTSPVVQSLKLQLSQLRQDEARLSQSLGDRHPDMIRTRAEIKAAEEKLAFEIRGSVQALESQVEAARQQEAALVEQLAVAQKELLDLGKRSVDFAMLQREVETQQQLLEDLMGRAKRAGLATGTRATNVRIVELAESPRAPFSPQRRRNWQFGLILGLALGIGLALLLEQLDNTIKTPDEIKNDLGLPFLGMVPLVEFRGGPASVQKLMADNPQSSVAEAYRLLRTNLMFTAPGASGLVIVVSSANPSEGKTTTVANLAASLAQNGSKVLAVDGDLRRPTLHQHFAVHKTPGLSDLIVGKAQASEAVQVTRFRGLHVLPCGYIPPNPSELLGSPAMRDVVKALKLHYDWVIIDTPPVLAMADTPVVCPFTDGLVLVVSAEHTTRSAIERSIDQVQGVGGKLLGVVLNRVNLERNAYYYSQYYGEYYRSYYSDAAPKAERKPTPVKTAKRA
ncbi:MAG: GumC family protein [Vicinamibacteria bacterium]